MASPEQRSHTRPGGGEIGKFNVAQPCPTIAGVDPTTALRRLSARPETSRIAGAYVSTVLDDFSRCVSALVAISLNKGSFLPASLLIVLLP